MFFRLLSILYAAGSALRNFLFDHNLLKSHKLSVPVISVGNLTSGGSGKTPLTLLIGQILKRNNTPFGILSRGYGRVSPRPFAIQSGAGLTARELGDEPKMLFERLGCPLGIGANRVRMGRLLLLKFGPRALLLDDGFSHRRIARDIDIVVVDGHNLFGKSYVPHGIRREGLRGLARASGFVITRNTPALDDAEIRATLERYAPGRPVFTACRKPLCVVAPDGRESAFTELSGKSFYLFSGIADGSRFEQTAREAGLDVKASVPYSDHYVFEKAEIDHLRENAGDALLLTTEKDWWRLDGLRDTVHYLRIALEMDKPAEFERWLLTGLPGPQPAPDNPA